MMYELAFSCRLTEFYRVFFFNSLVAGPNRDVPNFTELDLVLSSIRNFWLGPLVVLQINTKLYRFYWVLPRLSGCGWVQLVFTGSWWISLAPTRSYWVLLGFHGFKLGCTDYYWVLPGFGFSFFVLMNFLGATRCYWVLLGFHLFSWVLLGLTGF